MGVQMLQSSTSKKQINSKMYLTIMCQCCPHIETSQLICTGNQLTSFYMRTTLALNGLQKMLIHTQIHG